MDCGYDLPDGEDMSHYGAHAPGTAESARKKLTPVITALIEGNDAQYLIAESPQHGRGSGSGTRDAWWCLITQKITRHQRHL